MQIGFQMMNARASLRCLRIAPAVAATAMLLAPTAHAIRPVELAKLTPGDGAAGDIFGGSVALDNGLALLGALGDDDNGLSSGSAYLFDAATGIQLAKLTPDDGATGDFFGASVALHSNLALVGAYQDDDNGIGSGSAYLFDTVTSTQLRKLTPDDGDTRDVFGFSVALEDTLALVSAYLDYDNGLDSGSAYLFDTATGAQLDKLISDDISAGDEFGFSAALDGGIALIGAPGDDDNGSRSGSAYLFDAATGSQLAKLTPNDGTEGDRFGVSVTLKDGLVLVGADSDDDNGGSSGSAYLFDAATGSQLAKLTPNDGTMGDQFGFSVALDGGFALVGALWDDDNGSGSGGAYLFDTASGAQLAKLTPGDGAEFDLFGLSVALDTGLALVGAKEDDDNGSRSGSAYLFRVPEPASGPLVALALVGIVKLRKRKFRCSGC